MNKWLFWLFAACMGGTATGAEMTPQQKKIALAPGLVGYPLKGERITPSVIDELSLSTGTRITIGGHWGMLINQCLQNRVLAQEIPPLIRPFQERKDKTEWRSEFWGKWITSAELACRWEADPRLRAKIGMAVTNLVETQSPDGYIGAYVPTNRLWNWDIWGRKYSLLGLLGWHDLTGDPYPLTAASKLANHLLTEVGPTHPEVNMFRHDMWNGMACSSVIEPMMLLYRKTADPRYLEFAEWVVKQWERPDGPDLLRKSLRGESVFNMFPGPKPVIKDYMDAGHSKAYEMMSCFEGLVELYRVTGKNQYRDAAIKVFDDIAKTEITVIGSGSDWERWCNGTRRQTEPWKKGMETCVTVTWIKFAAQLQRITGEAKYGDFIETAAFNALLGSIGTNGDWFCHHAPLAGEKERAPEQCDMHQNCCVASGPRGLMLLPLLAVLNSPEGLAINLYGEMETEIALQSSNRVTITQKTEYPIGDTINISVNPARKESFAVKLRIPAWSKTSRIEINGQPQPAPAPGQWSILQRTWNKGDLITLHLDMEARLEQAPGTHGYAAIARGPMVLARDARLGENVEEIAPIQADEKGRVRVKQLDARKGPFWTTWSAPLANGGQIKLCDFSSAGNTWSRASQYRVWLPQSKADGKP